MGSLAEQRIAVVLGITGPVDRAEQAQRGTLGGDLAQDYPPLEFARPDVDELRAALAPFGYEMWPADGSHPTGSAEVAALVGNALQPAAAGRPSSSTCSPTRAGNRRHPGATVTCT